MGGKSAIQSILIIAAEVTPPMHFARLCQLQPQPE